MFVIQLTKKLTGKTVLLVFTFFVQALVRNCHYF